MLSLDFEYARTRTYARTRFETRENEREFYTHTDHSHTLTRKHILFVCCFFVTHIQ